MALVLLPRVDRGWVDTSWIIISYVTDRRRLLLSSRVTDEQDLMECNGLGWYWNAASGIDGNQSYKLV